MATLLNKFKKEREAENSPPSFQEGGGSTADWTKLSVKDRERFILNYLKNETSWPHHVIVGILGNMKRETPNLDLGYKQGSKNTIGLAHWEGPRKDKLLAKGNVSNPVTQLQFLIEEIETGSGFNGGVKDRDKLMSTKDIKDATFAFTDLYERPSKPAYSSRLSYANEIAKNHTDIIKPAIHKTDSKEVLKWGWGKNSDSVKVDNLHGNILGYLSTLEPEYQKKIKATSGNDGSSHTKGSRHYKNNAVDLAMDKDLYNRVVSDPKRKEYGITLLPPNHGTGPHLHLSFGQGSENKKDVHFGTIGPPTIDVSNQNYSNSESYADTYSNQMKGMAEAMSKLSGIYMSPEDIERMAKAEGGLDMINAQLLIGESQRKDREEQASLAKIQQEALEKEQQQEQAKKQQEQEAYYTALQEEAKVRDMAVNSYAKTFQERPEIDPAIFSAGQPTQFQFNTRQQFQQKGGFIEKAFNQPNLLSFKQKYKL